MKVAKCHSTHTKMQSARATRPNMVFPLRYQSQMPNARTTEPSPMENVNTPPAATPANPAKNTHRLIQPFEKATIKNIIATVRKLKNMLGEINVELNRG